MTKSLTLSDVLGLGFMTFAFYLGAGNIIFPPLAGFMAGENLLPAMFGFLITAVGLPLVTILAVAKAGNGWAGMTRLLPTGVATVMATAIYIVIGPAFAAPRTGLVAYEMGLKPFLGDAGQAGLIGYSIVFFVLAMLVSLNQGKLMDAIGKYLTPVLIVLLLVLAGGVLLNPQGAMPPASGEYVNHPLIKGMLEGYNTMDTLASLMFGALIVDLLRKKDIHDYRSQFKYLAIAGSISALGLSVVYVSLFQLGNTAMGVVSAASNGGVIVSAYVLSLFGMPGQFILAAIITLACFTTAVGLISACSDYFHHLTGVSYRTLVLIMGVICALVANVGLSQLISISIPVLVAIYPVAVALVLVTFLKQQFARPTLSVRVVLTIAFMFGCLDGLGAAGMKMSAFSFLPLFDKGLAWLLPTCAACVFFMLLPRRSGEVVGEAA
ncbi:branched-chain amino acid:cation transporter, LIVCS family [Aeromonas sp. RU39B]|uniref:branched-chain amino acid transport system II carrier protein n=1 Tax=Aeromonas sp. RU39B TaxID=1907416 RepID=UPI000955766C|nr:branched-chain amino acid transport system II carrier protein [Aeromonas sp. RU39B]SIR45881.1 branched-chain amino acid:cation transporter, LIVCS family [Aeromonas sp. RU39B]